MPCFGFVCVILLLLLPFGRGYYTVSGLLLKFFWCPSMAINVNVQYNGGLLPDILLLTYGYYHWGTRLNTMFWLCMYNINNTISREYYTVFGLFLMFLWCPCMAINVNVQNNGGLLPDIILLTQSYLHWGTCLNTMKRFLSFQPLTPPKHFDVSSPKRGMLKNSRCCSDFSLKKYS